jgi:hypothetical protein
MLIFLHDLYQSFNWLFSKPKIGGSSTGWYFDTRFEILPASESEVY